MTLDEAIMQLKDLREDRKSFLTDDADDDDVFRDDIEAINVALDALGKSLGKWQICCDGYYPYCSNCKHEPPSGVMTDYCPHCGTYMKGENKMTEKLLGKITCAEYGASKDYPFMMGLTLFFHLQNGCEIGCGGKYTVNVSDVCKWSSDDERQAAITGSVLHVNQILRDAGVCYVSELVGKPVEVTIEDNTFKDFRILTEVL